MGMQRGNGSRYDGPHGVVFWPLLAYRSPNNVVSLYWAASVRDLVARVQAGDNPPPPLQPDPNWAQSVVNRVVAWNGGASDVP